MTIGERAMQRKRASGALSMIRQGGILSTPAAEQHDAKHEAPVAKNFLFSFHNEMLASRFDRPSLILSGRQDSISGYADTIAMLECYPRATYGLLDTAGHSRSWERPPLFKAAVQDWLRRLEQMIRIRSIRIAAVKNSSVRRVGIARLFGSF